MTIMQLKYCGRCFKYKELDLFSKNKSRKDGLNNYCKVCMKSYLKNHYNNNKRYYIDKAKNNSDKYLVEFIDFLKMQSCKDCGNSDIRVLEFDHKHDKCFNISDKVGQVPLKTLLPEIEKCDIVCANCHKIRTSITQGWLKALTGIRQVG
ncbi:TPA: hypothetical protein MA058_003532 [Klebsiella pneumoniae]|nr:hypothetical protein [Klebsiella pneumoniae]